MIQVTCFLCGRKLYEYESASRDGEVFGACFPTCPDSDTPPEAAPSSGHAGAPVAPVAASSLEEGDRDRLDERGSWPAVRRRGWVTFFVVIGSILIPVLAAAFLLWTRGVRPW